MPIFQLDFISLSYDGKKSCTTDFGWLKAYKYWNKPPINWCRISSTVFPKSDSTKLFSGSKTAKPLRFSFRPDDTQAGGFSRMAITNEHLACATYNFKPLLVTNFFSSCRKTTWGPEHSPRFTHIQSQQYPSSNLAPFILD